MATDIYLFDVDRGQCLAIKSESSNWYIFDLGCSNAFSPVSWITEKYGANLCIEELTLSHYHGDHLGDIAKINSLNVYDLYHVEHDDLYIADCFLSNSQESAQLLHKSIKYINSFKSPWHLSYVDEVDVTRLKLTMPEIRRIGGSSNTKVNNSSIVSRINLPEMSILICGDMETSGWDYIFSQNWFGRIEWNDLVKNIDVLVAPHHGHSSGFSAALMKKAKPSIVLASIASKNPHIDPRYSAEEFIKGWNIDGKTRRLLTTRKEGHIKISITQRTFQKNTIKFLYGEQVTKKGL